eukprot:4894959-Pleurochrysis_carterae.AAC.1
MHPFSLQSEPMHLVVPLSYMCFTARFPSMDPTCTTTFPKIVILQGVYCPQPILRSLKQAMRSSQPTPSAKQLAEPKQRPFCLSLAGSFKVPCPRASAQAPASLAVP